MLNTGFPAGLIAVVVPHIGRDPVGWLQAGLEPKLLNRPAWKSLRIMFPDMDTWRGVFGYTRLVHLFIGGLSLDDWGITDLAPYNSKDQRLELADWIVRPPANVNVAALVATYEQLV